MTIKGNRNLFIFLTSLLLIPVWYFQYFPTIDGPSHVANAANVMRLVTGSCSLVSNFYELTQGPVPNWAGHLFMALGSLVIPAYIAEKLLLSLIILGFSYGTYIHMQKDENRSVFIFLLMLFTLSCVLFIGTYNFLISSSLAFIFFKWWMSHYKELNKSNFIKLFIIYICLYFSHLLGYAVFIIFCGTYLIFNLVFRQEKFTFKKFFSICIFNFLAGLPTLLMGIWYLSLPKEPIEGSTAFSEKLVYTFFPTSLYNFGELEKSLVVLVCIGVWFVTSLVIYSRFRNKTKVQPTDYYLFLSFIFSALILVTPASFGGGWMIESRFQLFQWIFLIIWLSTNNYSKGAKLPIAVVSVILFCLSLAVKLNYVEKYDTILAKFAQAKEHIPDNSVIFAQDITPFVVDYNNSQKNVRIPVPNITGYITSQKCIVEASNFHAAETNTFPVKYKDNLNPNKVLGQFRNINSLPIIPPIVDFKKYEETTGTKIDYVILRGDENYIYDYANNKTINPYKLYDEFMKQINQSYTLDWQSTDNLVRIYKHREK